MSSVKLHFKYQSNSARAICGLALKPIIPAVVLDVLHYRATHGLYCEKCVKQASKLVGE